MDLIGHLAVIEQSGVLPGNYVWGDGMYMAFFPNLAHCHEWAYANLWDAHRDERGGDAGRAIQGHMICDWVIHYGPTWTPSPERIGWAYREMPRAVALLDAFMDHHTAVGTMQADPRQAHARERLERDFGHTVVECAVDFLLADDIVDGQRLESVRRGFARLADQRFARDLIDRTFDELNGYTKEPEAVVARTTSDYARWAALVDDPRAFAALTLSAKYGIAETSEATAVNMELLTGVAAAIDRAGIRAMFDEIVATIAQPDLALTR